MKQLHTLNIFQLAKMARRNPMLARAASSEANFRIHQQHIAIIGSQSRCSLPKKQQRLMGLLPTLPVAN